MKSLHLALATLSFASLAACSYHERTVVERTPTVVEERTVVEQPVVRERTTVIER